MIKLNQNIKDYKYILAFDLAKRVSGYSLWDFQEDKVLACGIIDTRLAASEFIWDYFYKKVQEVIKECLTLVKSNKKLILTKEKLPTQAGIHSTIDTLQGLAQTHAIFDLAVYHTGVEVYDYEGVHSVSVKAYFKSLLGIEKPQKEDIANYLREHFTGSHLEEYPFDVTDSLGVAITLVGKKYESDIKEGIKELKKELKSAKSTAKQNRLQEEIKKLQEFLE